MNRREIVALVIYFAFAGAWAFVGLRYAFAFVFGGLVMAIMQDALRQPHSETYRADGKDRP